jgi:antitoxin component YwqK of YwqJK toxin-antitoxin module
MKYIYFIFILCFSIDGFAQLEKKETFYARDVKERVFYINEKGLEEGEDITYYYNGAPKMIRQWKNGMLKDSIVNYRPSGEIYSVGYIRKDSLRFFSKPFDMLLAEIPLINGRKHGTAVHYNEEGKIIMFENFKNGDELGFRLSLNEKTNFLKYITDTFDISDGLFITFYDNGRIERMRNIDSSNNGFSIWFYDNGVIMDFETIFNGKTEGWRYKYNQDGDLNEKVLYKEGNVLKRIKLD